MATEDKIDLSKVDWNNLSFEDYQQLNRKIGLTVGTSGLPKKSVGSKNKMIVVKIGENKYSIPENLYVRLNNLVNDKSKQDLINEIKTNYTPIMEL